MGSWKFIRQVNQVYRAKVSMLGRRSFHTFEERKFLARVFKNDFEKNDLTKDDHFWNYDIDRWNMNARQWVLQKRYASFFKKVKMVQKSENGVKNSKSAFENKIFQKQKMFFKRFDFKINSEKNDYNEKCSVDSAILYSFLNPWGISIFVQFKNKIWISNKKNYFCLFRREKYEYFEKNKSKIKTSSGNEIVVKKKSVIFLFSEIFCLSRKIEQKLGQKLGFDPLKSQGYPRG